MSNIPEIDVLIIEDDPSSAALLVHALQHAGLSTDAAGDVLEAKRLLKRGPYKVVVLDLLLPDGTGIDVLHFIKSGSIPRPRIIVTTAASDVSLLAQLDRSLVKHVTFKPLDIAEVVRTIRDLVRDSTRHRV